MTRSLSHALYALIGASVPVSLAFAGGEHGRAFDHPQMWGGGGGFGMFFGLIVMILVIAVIVGVIVLLVRWLGGSSAHRGRTEKTALRILEERYARGEIDAQEFEERRRILGE